MKLKSSFSPAGAKVFKLLKSSTHLSERVVLVDCLAGRVTCSSPTKYRVARET